MYLSMVDEHMISLELSGSCSKRISVLSTHVRFSVGHVLINTTFQEDEYKGNEIIIWTTFLLDICRILSNALPSFQIVSIFLFWLQEHNSLIFLNAYVIVWSILVIYELQYDVAAYASRMNYAFVFSCHNDEILFAKAFIQMLDGFICSNMKWN